MIRATCEINLQNTEFRSLERYFQNSRTPNQAAISYFTLNLNSQFKHKQTI